MDGEKSACADGEERRDDKLDQDNQVMSINGNKSLTDQSNQSNLTIGDEPTPSKRKSDQGLESKVNTPNVSIASLTIHQILNSTRKKKPLPDLSRITHHREYRRLSGRLSFKEPPKGPFFISFKTPPGTVETDNYDKTNVFSYFHQAYSNHRCIGKGSFGEVFKAFCKDDKRWYAVKLAVDPFRSPGDRKKKLQEVQKHELLPKHPNLISFVCAWEEIGFLYIQTELCESSLLEYKMNNKNITENDLWLFFGDIVSAVRFLHNRNLLHMDIKPQNVMVSFDKICKLGDFSLILDLEKESTLGIDGDAKYLAPEVLGSGANKPSDIFSLGMTMIDVCTELELPNSGPFWEGFRKRDINPDYIRDVPSAFLDAILPLLEPDPSKRPTADEICLIPTVAKCLSIRQKTYIERNLWWISSTVGYCCLFGSSWAVQPVRTARMRKKTYLKMATATVRRRRCVFQASQDESPLFAMQEETPKFTGRLHLNFDEPDEDYSYVGGETNSQEDKMETGQSDDEELMDLMETSVGSEPRPDMTEASSTSSRMDVDAGTSSSTESIRALQQELHDMEDGYGGDANISSHSSPFRKPALCGFGAAGDAFGKNECKGARLTRAPKKRSNVGRSVVRRNGGDLPLRSACDPMHNEVDEEPSSSASLFERPKTPEPPEEATLPDFPDDSFVTPPNSKAPSPHVCKTPVRGSGLINLPEQRRLLRWRESIDTPTKILYRPRLLPGCTDWSAASPAVAKHVEDICRRRARRSNCELAPPAKRAQMENDKMDDSDSDEQKNRPGTKKSDADNYMDIELD